MELVWRKFDDGVLSGMEAFVDDDLSIHIVRYAQGDGFHWVTRSWNDADECEVIQSWDEPELVDGFSYLSDAYQDVMHYLVQSGIFTDVQAEEQTQPGIIKSFLQKAVSLGLATIVSFTVISGAASPVLAWADSFGFSPVSHSENAVYLESQDGMITVASPVDASAIREMWIVSSDGEQDQLVRVSEGSELYNMVIEEAQSGFAGADGIGETFFSNPKVGGGIVSQNGAYTMVLDDADGTINENEWKPLANAALEAALSVNIGVGETKEFAFAVYDGDEYLSDALYDELAASSSSKTREDFRRDSTHALGIAFGGAILIVVMIVGGASFIIGKLNRKDGYDPNAMIDAEAWGVY